MSKKKQADTKQKQQNMAQEDNLETKHHKSKGELGVRVTTKVTPTTKGKKLQVHVQLTKNGEVVAEDYDFVVI